MTAVAEILKTLLASLAPLAIIVFSIITIASFLKWLAKLSDSIKTIGKQPISIIGVLLIIGALGYLYIRFVAPILS